MRHETRSRVIRQGLRIESLSPDRIGEALRQLSKADSRINSAII